MKSYMEIAAKLAREVLNGPSGNELCAIGYALVTEAKGNRDMEAAGIRFVDAGQKMLEAWELIKVYDT